MVKVVRRPNETNEQLFKRFRKRVSKSKIMSEARRRRWYVSKSELRRIKREKAIRRMRRNQRRYSRRRR